ncbi:hypothetical protein IRP63_16040 (plasmid) [Clostridium botulinum]|uniref:Uncharacterized protein n=1 Tax=Clostridium botulinum C/D str. DC5 TaxID=1443128 RepID=A0A0A0I456_CLOBO|nr:hypothetical protein [Clostridium botulinum]KGM96154.1 hypothetical protein Z955_13310 [Clostridium botulinum C/D str. DC5]KOC56632.1 hypothetical protein ADU89_02435 [Clostridium botulinum]KOC58195.1 hypothetical protein ADU90_01820 [Clostridium botulinum]MCD3235270.1 hypothetical protein [Clostridium botulinum D/C]MCD3241193.1 hypothetical protein [Clostridium botulinum D/C]
MKINKDYKSTTLTEFKKLVADYENLQGEEGSLQDYISTIDWFNFTCDNETNFIAMQNGDVYINTKDWDIDNTHSFKDVISYEIYNDKLITHRLNGNSIYNTAYNLHGEDKEKCMGSSNRKVIKDNKYIIKAKEVLGKYNALGSAGNTLDLSNTIKQYAKINKIQLKCNKQGNKFYLSTSNIQQILDTRDIVAYELNNNALYTVRFSTDGFSKYKLDSKLHSTYLS